MTNMTSSNVMTEAKQIRAKDLVPNGKETDGSIHYDEVRTRTDADLVEMWKAKFEAVDHPGRNAIIEIMALFTESLNGREINLQKVLAELNWNDRFLKGKVDAAQSTADGAVSVNNQQNTRLDSIEIKNTQQDSAISNVQSIAESARTAANSALLQITSNISRIDNAITDLRNNSDSDDLTFGGVLDAQGWIKILNGGPIIQWGVQYADNDEQTFPLHINFAANNYMMICSPRNSGTDYSILGVSAKTTSSFTIKKFKQASGSPTTYFDWIAIGRSR